MQHGKGDMPGLMVASSLLGTALVTLVQHSAYLKSLSHPPACHMLFRQAGLSLPWVSQPDEHNVQLIELKSQCRKFGLGSVGINSVEAVSDARQCTTKLASIMGR